MKFSEQILFNSVPEWKVYYINYAQLKRLIYAEEAARLAAGRDVGEGRPGTSPGVVDAAAASAEKNARLFLEDLRKELEKVLRFFTEEEERIYNRFQLLVHGIRVIEDQESLAPFSAALDTSPTAPLLPALSMPTTPKTPPRRQGPMQRAGSAGLGLLRTVTGGFARPKRSPRVLHGSLSEVEDGTPRDDPKAQVWQQADVDSDIARKRDELRGQLSEVYQDANNMIEFRELNLQGFRKILKKHDKVLDGIPTAVKLLPTEFKGIKERLEALDLSRMKEVVEEVVTLYARVCHSGSYAVADEVLKKQKKDRVVFDRSTVWKEMVERERKRSAAHVEAGAAPRTWYQRHWQPIAFTFCLAVFATLLVVPTFEEPEKRNCAALLAFVSLLWCTEALPLFATAMLVPMLVVVLRVLVDRTADPPQRLTPQQAAPAVFKTMMSQVIMLLLASFAIAGALSKHFIARWLAQAFLSKFGKRPRTVLIANMGVATFASMWISNVAAPVLCFSLLQPILRNLSAKDKFAKALVLGIALASNLGGMTSPIASPQNLFAIQQMSIGGDAPSWLAWFLVALPVAFVGNMVCWGLLLLVYKPPDEDVRELHEAKDFHMNRTQLYVIAVSLLTVALWCCNGYLTPYFGEMGVIAIFPLVAFFGFGVLDKDDFNAFLWNVVILAMGGMALGSAVDSSGLLLTIAKRLETLVSKDGPWTVLAIFCALVLFATTFVSHTVGAIVILPIVRAVGETMTDPHPKMLVMGAALMCSGAMGLPVSGFPNMNAISLEDKTGLNYLRTRDFLLVGVPSSIATWGIIVSLGYALMKYGNGW